MFAASSTASPQYRAYGGCTSAGCIPATIVPMTSGFWPNGDVLVGLQTQEQLQNQNGQQVQRDDSGNSGGSGNIGGLGNIQSNTGTSTPTPVIYIARAGSDQYKYSPGSSTPSPVGSGVGWGSAGLTGNQGSQGSSQNQFGNAEMQNQGTFGNTDTNSGSQFQQGQNFQNLQNQGSSVFQNNGQNVQNTQNPFSQGSSNGQFGSSSQNQFGSSNSNSGLTGSSNSQSPFQGSQNNLPFGPNMMPSNGQFGPQPRPNPPPKPFSENDWNFHPGSQGVHFVGNGQGQVGNGISGMTDEAQQIAAQIQAIRDNLSITRDESAYLINQLKASLPPDLQNQLQSV